MKFLLFIPISFIILLQSLHLSIEDVVRIPQFVEHFQEHQQNYDDNLLSFINKHYGAKKDSHEEEEHDRHKDLPFHNSHHVCLDLKIDLPQILIVDKSIALKSAKHYFVYQPPHAHSVAYSLFQPPKTNC